MRKYGKFFFVFFLICNFPNWINLLIILFLKKCGVWDPSFNTFGITAVISKALHGLESQAQLSWNLELFFCLEWLPNKPEETRESMNSYHSNDICMEINVLILVRIQIYLSLHPLKQTLIILKMIVNVWSL